jgi:ribosomal-protein-alanine N-acetyltransferase
MKKNNYVLASARLGYRVCLESDLQNLILLDSDPEVRAFFPMGVATEEQIKERIKEYETDFRKKGYGLFILEDLTTREFVGRCGFKELETGEIEVGYVLLKKFWGQGLASEALTALLHWAEEHVPTDKIIAFAPKKHLASQRVMQKSGMQYAKNAMMYGVECVFYEKKSTYKKIRENP